ncbi:16S rRNA methyltransferase [Bifidobacterium catulorum]|uniref:16S rRNA methyltransferase n=1 Tax=Bifidobacterium catulorum TaxID=1630173 RepID=A0A2U2MQJ7_9BIFI|nr:16S rRNA methyltransferase [Bifidobacterium catulorum]
MSSSPRGGHDSRRPGGNRGGVSRRPGNKPSGDPRLVAYDVTARIGSTDSFSNLLLPGALAAAGMDPRGNAFATQLVYGTQRWRGLIDAVIEAAAKRASSAIDAHSLDVLRIGVYQALFMNVADHAVVSQTVDLARRRAGSRSAGFVNAVMRRIVTRDLKEWQSVVVSRIAKDDHPQRLAVRYSHPRWIVEELSRAWDAAGYPGEEDSETSVAAMLARDNDEPDVTLVARPGLIDRDELADRLPRTARLAPGRWSPYALRVHGVNPERVDAVRRGVAGVEDEGSQLAALALANAETSGGDGAGEAWLDLCAGPGGKTALLGAIAAGRGATLTANEPSHHRAQLVRDNTRALPPAVMTGVLEHDGRDIGTMHPDCFDRILVDAPCSGLGSLRRRPEARWRKRPEDLTALADVQRGLLESALRAVRVGGMVAYVTCSPALAETRDIVDAVLDGTDAVERLDATAVLRRISPDMPLPGREGDVQLFEHLHDTDQMFISLMRRTR